MKSPTGQYADGKATGEEIAVEAKYADAWMGCLGGTKGLLRLLKNDPHAWRHFAFEYNAHAVDAPSPNWFTVSEFREELAKRGLTAAPSPAPDEL